MLVDTGFGLDDMREPAPARAALRHAVPPAGSRGRDRDRAGPRARLRSPSDVRHIVATHLDLDHAGGLPDFPDAEVHVLGRELEAALHPSWRERARYVAAHWAHGPKWVEHEAEGDDWFGFESVRMLPGSDAEILLIPLPGHTRGHTGVAIKRRRGLAAALRRRLLPPRRDRRRPPHCPPVLTGFQNAQLGRQRARGARTASACASSRSARRRGRAVLLARPA